MASTKKCGKCGRELALTSFPPSNAIFSDGTHTFPWCADCLETYFAAFVDKDPTAAWNEMDAVCRAANIAFLPNRWTKLYTALKARAPFQYLTLLKKAESYSSIDWREQNAKWEELLAQGRIGEIHEAFNADELKVMRDRWGKQYNEDELRQLQDLYDGIKNSFGVGDAVGEDNARKLAMLSLEIDKCIASGGSGLDKLITPYNKIQANAGFTADNTRDMNSFESVSELMLYMEKTGWKKKFVTDVPRDLVDLTIKDIQAHNTRLYKGESTMSDQIDDKLKAIMRVEELENRKAEEDSEAFFDESYLAKDDILLPGLEDTADEDAEEFKVNFD